MSELKNVEEVERRVMFAVRKRDKYLYRYQNKKAEWTYAIDVAHMFLDREMANNFAGITQGRVVSVEIIVKKY
jgi:hypothetical protein